MRLVAFDLDGTLLDSHHQITERTIAVLRKLSDLGIVVAIATGRSKANIDRYIRQLDLAQRIIPVVCYNGAYGLQYARDGGSYNVTTVFANAVPAHSAKKVIEFAEQHNLVVQYYNGESGEVYAVPKNDSHVALLGRYAALVDNKQVLLQSYDEAVAICATAKALIMTEDADHLLKLVKEHLDPEEFTVIRGSPDPFFVEFLRPDVTKGAGLALLCDHLKINLEDVVAFGDGDNDKEMLQMAGLGCAMRNAKEAAKNAANIVTTHTNDEDGVARHLELLLEEGVLRSRLL